jgi:hypothetical protein
MGSRCSPTPVAASYALNANCFLHPKMADNPDVLPDLEDYVLEQNSKAIWSPV